MVVDRKRPIRGPAIPLHTRLKVRNLYLGTNLTHAEISEKTGLPEKSVGHLISRDGLPKHKRRREAKLLANTDARTDATLEAFNEQLAQEAEEISLGALQRAREEVEAPGEFGARNFQSWTGGINNLVKASRAVRGLDSKQAQDQGATVNLFIVAGERVQHSQKAELKNVTPTIETAQVALPK